MNTSNALLAASVAFFAATAYAGELDPAGVFGVRALMRNEATLAATKPGVDLLLHWPAVGIVVPQHQATAADIRRTFDGNVVAAERRYSQPFIVSGTLHSISRRPDRQLVIRLAEGGVGDRMRRIPGAEAGPTLEDMTLGLAHGGAQAVLAESYADAVAGWNPRQKVSMRCRSASNVRLALLLEDCVPISVVIAEAERLADAQADLAISGKQLTVVPPGEADPVKTSEKFLLFSYLTGLAGKRCSKEPVEAWASCALRELKDKRRSTALMEQAVRDLGIPNPVKCDPECRPK